MLGLKLNHVSKRGHRMIIGIAYPCSSSNNIPVSYVDMITYPCPNFSLSILVKRGPGQNRSKSKEFPMFNPLRPRQNGDRFADDTFKRIFLNENSKISIKISLKFVPKCPINNIPALVQIIDKSTDCDPLPWPAPSHYLNQWWLVYWRIYASLGLNELMDA